MIVIDVVDLELSRWRELGVFMIPLLPPLSLPLSSRQPNGRRWNEFLFFIFLWNSCSMVFVLLIIAWSWLILLFDGLVLVKKILELRFFHFFALVFSLVLRCNIMRVWSKCIRGVFWLFVNGLISWPWGSVQNKMSKKKKMSIKLNYEN